MANPYHDKEGKFTSQDKQGSAEPKQKGNNFHIKLKAGVDLSNFPKPENIKVGQPTQPQPVEPQYSGKIDTTVQLTMPTSIEDAMDQGNKILGFKSVFYTNKTDLATAHEMNKALQMVVNDFPELFSDQQLLGYGNDYKKALPTDPDINTEKIKKREREVSIVKNILARPQWQQALQNGNYTETDVLDDITYVMHLKEKNHLAKDPVGRDCGGISSNMGKFSAYRPLHGLVDTGRDTSITSEFNVLDVVRVNSHFHTIKDWNDAYFYSIQTRYHLPYGGTNAVISNNTHELGHHCLYSLSRMMNQQEFNRFWQLTDPQNAKMLYSQGQISGYAKKNRHEHVAECFADHYSRGDNATTHNKELFNFLKGVYNRIYGTNKI